MIPFGFELFLVVFLIVGIIISFILKSVFLKFVVIFIFGFISVLSYRFTGLNFPYIILALAFVVGYVLFSGSSFWLIVCFLLGVWFGKLFKPHIQRYFKIK